jgi:hypothetical protein
MPTSARRTHARAAKEIKEQTPKLDDGKMSTFWHGSSSITTMTIDDLDDVQPAYLGDMGVDENIDKKLREVIGSVHNTLSRCMAISGRIGRA